MPEDDNERLSVISKLYAAHVQNSQRANWGYRAAFLMFACFLISAFIVLLLQLAQPIYDVGAICLISVLFFFVSSAIAIGAFGAQPTRKE